RQTDRGHRTGTATARAGNRQFEPPPRLHRRARRRPGLPPAHGTRAEWGSLQHRHRPDARDARGSGSVTGPGPAAHRREAPGPLDAAHGEECGSGRRRQASPRNRLGPAVRARPDPGRYLELLEAPVVKIAVIGTGYVGLVTGTCLAESGNDVVGIDKDQRKIETLESGRLPIYEPGLLELVQRNRREDRLRFPTDFAQG